MPCSRCAPIALYIVRDLPRRAEPLVRWSLTVTSINGTRTTIPSHRLKKGDVLTVREGSKQSSLFGHLAEGEDKLRATPRWISVDPTLIKVEILQEPIYGPAETTIDYKTVFEFYSR